MDASTACLFFRFCSRYHITKYEDKLAVIRALTKRKKARYLRDVETFIKGKKVLRLRPKE